MIDTASGEVVWRGRAEEVANPTYTDVVRKINQALDKLFEHFPPPPALRRSPPGATQRGKWHFAAFG